jgi:hydrogenase maturation protease
MARVVIIGIGNPLRSDDGLGWRVADQFSRDRNLQVLKVHQLTPEIAETLRQVDLAIFVDANAQGVPGTLRCERMHVEGAGLRFSHHLRPTTLLKMAADLYGAKPVAYSVSLAGKSFAHGDSLSPETAEELPRVVAKLRELIAQV